MCRLMAYKGTSILLDELLYKPKNSLITSINARELEEPLNANGFGVDWYSHHISQEPATFVSLNPAWSNRNLRIWHLKFNRIACWHMFGSQRGRSFGSKLPSVSIP